MRTTMTLEDDLARQLRGCAHRSGLSFKKLVNRALRAGLEQLESPLPRKPYRGPSHALGKPRGVNLDRALELAGRLEDEEIVRKLALRK